MTDTLPEVPLSEADPATRAIYERIMDATGVGSPALIYRHFAVHPGLLDWVWQMAGPELESGRIAGHALEAVAATPLATLPPVSLADMRATGIDEAAHRTIDGMLATYNRMNPVNLSLITAIRNLISGDKIPAARHEPLADIPPPPPATAYRLPAPLALSEMPDTVRQTVLAMSAAIPSPGTQVIPTLYRHLAIWPDFLMALAPGLLGAIESGEVEARMNDLNAAMRPLIDDVTHRARALNLPAPPLDDPAAMVRTLDAFLYTIPQLVVVGTALRAAIPHQEG